MSGVVAVDSTAEKAPTLSNQTARPDFSGRWRLVHEKSDFGKGDRPDSRVDVITHRDPELVEVLRTVRGGKADSLTYRFQTNGKRTVSKDHRVPMQAVTRWDGDAITFRSKMKMLMLEIKIEERWTLSPDRDTLTMARHMRGVPGAGVEERLVFERE